MPNHPNPFNPSTTIRLFVPGEIGSSSNLTVGVYDLQGRLIRNLYQGRKTSGWHDFVWNGRDDAGRSQASGVYFLRAQGAGRTLTTKMALVR